MNRVTANMIACVLVGLICAIGFPCKTPASTPQSLEDSESQPKRFSDPLPGWVERGSYVEGGTEFMVISSEERAKEREAEDEMWASAKLEVDRKINELLAPSAADALNISRDYIREHLLVPDHVHKHSIYIKGSEELAEIRGSDTQHSFRFYSLLKLDKEFESWARSSWEEQLVRSRVRQTGLVGLSVIVCLTLLLGYFQLDHKTRGFYSGRLQTITLAVLLVLAVLALALSKSFIWL